MSSSRSLLSILLALFASGSMAEAQMQAWVARDGGEMADPLADVGRFSTPNGEAPLAVDASGNVYAVGSVYNGRSFDLITIKLDSAGVRQWAVTHDSGTNDEAIAVVLDDAGSVYVLGRVQSPSYAYRVVKYNSAGLEQWRITPFAEPQTRILAMVGDGSGNVVLAGRSAGRALTAKYDSAGVQQWSRSWTVSSIATAAALDGNGNVYVAGGAYNGVNWDFLVVKYDSAGVEQWGRVENAGGNEEGAALAVDVAGGVRAMGTTQTPGIPAADILTVRYDTAGVKQWSAVYDGGASSSGYSLALDNAGNTLIAGSLDSPDGGDFLTIKYDATGALQWTAIYNGGGTDCAYGLDVDDSGNAYVTGYTSSSSDRFLTVKYDPAGAQQWAEVHAASGNGVGSVVRIDDQGRIHVAGTGNPPGDFDLRVVTYDANGVELWSAEEGTTENAAELFGNSLSGFQPRKLLAPDGAGSAYAAVTSYNGRNFDLRLVKYDSSGAKSWVATLDGGADDEVHALAVDTSGNSHLLARSWNGADYDWRLAKYDAAGALLRNISQGSSGSWDTPNDLVLDTAGNIYVVGQLQVPGQITAFRAAKFDSAGNLVWSRSVSTPRLSSAHCVAVDANGHVFVSGAVQNANLGWDLLLVKYDASGNEQWWTSAPDGVGIGIALDGAGNAYVAAQAMDFRLSKYDGSGAQQWEASFDSGNQDLVSALAVDPSGQAYLTGISWTGSFYAMRTSKYAAAGILQWSATHEQPGGAHAYGLALDAAGNAYVAGDAWNGNDFDFRLVKYDAAGSEQWFTTYDNGSTDSGYAAAVDAAGNVYIAGDSIGVTTGPDLAIVKYLQQTRRVEFAAAESSLSERAAVAAPAVVLTTSDGLPSASAVTVAFATADGSAIAGQDYAGTTSTLTFPAGTPSGTAQTLSLPLLDDPDDEEDETFTVSLTSATEATLGALVLHAVTLRDDDTAGFEIRPKGGLRTSEAGATDTFTVVLTSRPAASVTLLLESSDPTEGTVSPGSLTFTAVDWNVPQTVTLTGVDDVEVDGSVSYVVILHPAASSDPKYQGIDPDDVTARNADNDRRGGRP